ncbi:MAG: hypothetical protein JOZ22_27100 [Acidobacteriia bacterium]|nr:hypothetical protein [Terriglobia bacterium]
MRGVYELTTSRLQASNLSHNAVLACSFGHLALQAHYEAWEEACYEGMKDTDRSLRPEPATDK